MKANKHFKLSKSSKMMAATILNAERRNHFLRSMVQAEIVSRLAPPRSRNERKETQ